MLACCTNLEFWIGLLEWATEQAEKLWDRLPDRMVKTMFFPVKWLKGQYSFMQCAKEWNATKIPPDDPSGRQLLENGNCFMYDRYDQKCIIGKIRPLVLGYTQLISEAVQEGRVERGVYFNKFCHCYGKFALLHCPTSLSATLRFV